MLKIFFPERLARGSFWRRGIAVVVAGLLVAVLGAEYLEHRYGIGDLHLFMIFDGIPSLLLLSIAGARANDIRRKGGDDGMAHLGLGLPLAISFIVLMLDMPPKMLQPKLMGGLTIVPLLSAAWFLTLGICVIAFFYLGCVGPKDAREQPVDVDPQHHPFMGVPLVMFSIMCLAYGFAVSVAHYKAPALLAAAEKGDAAAQLNAAEMYNLGIAKKVDLTEAHKWLARAVDKGYAPAQERLAELYDEGRGVRADAAKATALYMKAAKQGWMSAQLELASRYGMGKGVRRDYVQAYVWYSRAARDNPASAVEALYHRETIWELMKPQQRQQARALAPKPPPPKNKAKNRKDG